MLGRIISPLWLLLLVGVWSAQSTPYSSHQPVSTAHSSQCASRSFVKTGILQNRWGKIRNPCANRDFWMLNCATPERLGPRRLKSWWLLQDRLNNWDTDLDEEELPEILARYQRYLEIFKRVLEEEEEKMSGGEKALSDLVRRSEDSGAMWLHMMLSWGFNHRHSLPFSQLRHHIGDGKWDQLEEPFFETDEMDKFTEQKMAQKEQYEQDLERTKADKADVDNQKMTAEEFVATL